MKISKQVSAVCRLSKMAPKIRPVPCEISTAVNSSAFFLENLIVGAFALLFGILLGNLVFQALRAILLALFGIPYTFTYGRAAGQTRPGRRRRSLRRSRTGTR